MAGFLSGLKDLLMGYDYTAAPAPQRAQMLEPVARPQDNDGLESLYDHAPQQMQRTPVELQGPPQQKREKGLLRKGFDWAVSPEGRLALGTAIRSGYGNDNAFADQARVLNRWDERENESVKRAEAAKAQSDAEGFNQLFYDSMKTDPVTGKRTFDQQAFAKGVAGLRGAVDPKKAVELMNAVSIQHTPVGRNVMTEDPLNPGDPQWSQAPQTEEEAAEAEARREEREARTRYYDARTGVVGQDSDTRRMNALKPPGGRGGGAPVDLSRATPEEIEAIIRKRSGGR